MRKILILLFLMLSLIACKKADKDVVFVWYPNDSTPEKAEAREELITIMEEALGKPIKEQLTTDYSIAIEALVNDNACFSWLGGEGYTQAHAKNKAIVPLVVDSGKSGTLSDAKYYSMLGVLKGNADMYKDGAGYSIDNLVQKKFSFVSNSSTSGFRVPSSVISGYFAKTEEFKGLTSQDLLEGGDDSLFSQVMFGGSHQGSMLNVLTDKSDVSAFCNICVGQYIDWVEGSFDDPAAGDVVIVKSDAAEPFDKYAGTEMVLISTTPVLNAPIVVNTNILNKEEIANLINKLTSDEVANNDKIFVPKSSGFTGIGFKAGARFVEVEDEWYDPIRKLSGLK
jgi:phosphonate transport system substrate-binding protein